MPENQRLTIEQLQHIQATGVVGASQIDAILLTLEASSEEQRAWAVDCLGLVEELPQELVGEAGVWVKSPNDSIVAWACRLLGKSNFESQSCQAMLCEVLGRHASISVQQEAAKALIAWQERGALSQDAISALTKASESSDARLKRIASQALEAQT